MKERLSAARDLVLDNAWAEPDDVRHTARVALWMRWIITGACLALLLYRPAYFPMATYVSFVLLMLAVVAGNIYLHFLLVSGRTIVWHRMLAMNGVDVALVTIAAVSTGGFSHYFQYLLYYPALAMFAAIFTSFRLNLAWVTMVAAVYVVMCFQVGDGVDFAAREDKTLIIRVVVMYAVVVVVNQVSGFERVRRRESVERERDLHRERIELSRTIHDTAAQTAYMLGLGVDRAKKMVGESNEELGATLDATADLSKLVIWELRHPMDAGQIHEGTSLGTMLQSHAATFTTVTSIPAEVVLHGVEPALTTEIRSRLFSISHNALTNAFRHARAGRVEVELNVGTDSVRLSLSDDGVGLPDDYDQRGHGFAGMRADAEAMGGRLTVETGGRRSGTTVTCTVPL